MKHLLRTAWAASLASLLTVAGCSSEGNEAGQFGGDLYVVSCSLSCTNGAGGSQVFCSIVNTYQNQEISIRFSEPIDLFSVNSSSFRVVDVSNGTSPVGQFFIDPLNPRRLIFRPSLTFDGNGNPNFGFDPNTTYEITIPGQAQGDSPPFIQSTVGRINQSRMQCTIITTEGIIDPVPGDPSVVITADVQLFDGAGNPTTILEDQVVNGGGPELIDVYRDSSVRFVFNDIMNVATLANPTTSTAPFIQVDVDADGSLVTSGDRQPVAGSYVVTVDQERLETTLVFTPFQSFPSAGSGAPANPRRIAIVVPEQVIDLVGNPVLASAGGGTQSFVPEVVLFGELSIPDDDGENFDFGYPDPNSNEDGPNTGGFWGGGQLAPGVAGGSGRLGPLHILQGQQIVLSTDGQDFPLGIETPQILGNPDALDFPDTLGNFPDSITISNGVFEFSSLIIEPGGSLRLEGVNPARFYVRGPVRVRSGGIINLSGVTPPAWNSKLPRVVPDPWLSTTTYGNGKMVRHQVPGEPVETRFVSIASGNVGFEPGVTLGWETRWDEVDTYIPINAANGGEGGFGADRYDFTGSPLLSLPVFDPQSDALENPGAVTDGRNGQGVGRKPNGAGQGLGGGQWPNNYPEDTITSNGDHNLNFNVVFLVDLNDDRCVSQNVGTTGSGGAYATDGTAGISISPMQVADFPFNAPNNGPDTSGGLSSQLGLEPPSEDNFMYVTRKLEWNAGNLPYPANLRGGSGGGGGSNHPFRTQSAGFDQQSMNNCIGISSTFSQWHDHSGATGGFGGGALHLTSGRELNIEGVIDASGGNGGNAFTGPEGQFFQYAMPGGGGSGGALRLQAPIITLAPTGGRLDVSGGVGGSAAFAPETRGGDGGAGLVRIETISTSVSHLSYAPYIAPYFGAPPPVLPGNATDEDKSLDFLSVDAGGFATPRQRPGSMTGALSCWFRPEGNFFAINFREDVVGSDDPDDFGWNMKVLWQPQGAASETEVWFRGLDANSPFPVSFEEQFGKLLGHDAVAGGFEAAPIAVRFQGARSSAAIDDLCEVPLDSVDSPILPGSVTPWVDHPALLNDFIPNPNMIRFSIVFDGTVDGGNNDVPGLVLLTSVNGITELVIRAEPD
jgi:hypothetical protein